jgi:hypothetical protein
MPFVSAAFAKKLMRLRETEAGKRCTFPSGGLFHGLEHEGVPAHVLEPPKRRERGEGVGVQLAAYREHPVFPRIRKLFRLQIDRTDHVTTPFVFFNAGRAKSPPLTKRQGRAETRGATLVHGY